MPTQEERLLTLKQAQINLGRGLTDLNHHVAMVEGILVKQALEIKEIRNNVRSVDNRLMLFELNVSNRFDALEQSVNSRFGEVDQRFREVNKRLEEFDQRFKEVDKRFDKVDQRLDGLDKKFDQVLVVLSKVAAKLE